MRIFSITQWHHFAYMIISIALLGFGASGTFIALFRIRLKKRFLASYRFFSCLFPLSILLSYVVSQQNTFNPFEIVWDTRQYLHLLEYYLVLFVPFFLAATCVGLMFTQYTDKIGLLYFFNLFGAGVGAVVGIVGLYAIHPVPMLYVIIGGGLLGTVSAFLSHGQKVSNLRAGNPRTITYSLVVGLTLLAGYSDLLDLRGHLNISQYKGLSLAKNFPDARIHKELVSPLGVVHAVSSPLIRNAPGLSLKYRGEIPRQIALFIDSGNAGVITEGQGEDEQLEFLDFLTTALGYHVRPASNVLILGAGGGMDVLNALYHHATTVDAIELDANIIYFVQDQFRDFSAGLYARPDVRVINQEIRGYIETTRVLYDSIHISLLDSFGASSAGVHTLHENYLYTIEALQRYYARLRPQGMLSITRWVKFPPRDNLKLFTTAVEALEEVGISDVSRYLVSIRSWATATLLISKSPFTSEEVERIRAFCRERAFDMNYFPGITAEDANLYNQIPAAEYFRAGQEVLFGAREAFYASYPYFVRPARDNSPYFFHFFTWRNLPALLKAMGKEWIPFIEWGYLVLLATLFQAGLLSIVLILLPLLTMSRRNRGRRALQRPGAWRLYTLFYFTCLGFAYLFLEVAYIQKFTLFLAHPVTSASVVIAAFLLSSGFGSLFFEVWGTGNTVDLNLGTPTSLSAERAGWKPAFPSHLAPRTSQLIFAVAGIIGVTTVYMVFLSDIFALCAGWHPWGKILLSVALIVPLGFCMGIPFPFGLKFLHHRADELVPWAYGINGYASVLSSLLATWIAISFGFQTVLFCAGVLYVLAVGVSMWAK